MQRWFMFAVLVMGCGDDVVEQDAVGTRVAECTRVSAHLVDLRLMGSEALGTIELEKHRAALASALGTQFVDNCTKALSDAQVACLLAAATSDDINRCNTTSAGTP